MAGESILKSLVASLAVDLLEVEVVAAVSLVSSTAEVVVVEVEEGVEAIRTQVETQTPQTTQATNRRTASQQRHRLQTIRAVRLQAALSQVAQPHKLPR